MATEAKLTDTTSQSEDCTAQNETEANNNAEMIKVNDSDDNTKDVLEKCEDDYNNPDPSEILNICSNTAHLIRATISNTLKNRDLNTKDNTIEDSLKEKLSDLNTAITSSAVPKIDETKADIKEQSPLTDELLEASSSPKNATDTLCEENGEQSVTPKQGSPNIEDKQAESTKSVKNVKSMSKRKVEKTMDQVLKSLQSYPTAEEKVQALCKKYLELGEDYKTYELKSKQNEKQCNNLNREKEQLQTEHNRTLLARSRLENVCRELQKQNRMIKEESLLRLREEEEKRKEVANKFQGAYQDITTMMKDHQEKNNILTVENGELAKKLKTLVDHYELWEQHMEKVLQQKEVEIKLQKAKLARANFLIKQDQEEFLKEKHQLLLSISDLQKKSTEMTSNEIQLRNELGQYNTKYEEFQTVLSKSNDVFASFKKDMDNMTKKIKKLEKETGLWKAKWENCNTQLINMVSTKQSKEKDLVVSLAKIEKLEKLCRALQVERNELVNLNKKLTKEKEEASPLPENQDVPV